MSSASRRDGSHPSSLSKSSVRMFLLYRQKTNRTDTKPKWTFFSILNGNQGGGKKKKIDFHKTGHHPKFTDRNVMQARPQGSFLPFYLLFYRLPLPLPPSLPLSLSHSSLFPPSLFHSLSLLHSSSIPNSPSLPPSPFLLFLPLSCPFPSSSSLPRFLLPFLFAPFGPREGKAIGFMQPS